MAVSLFRNRQLLTLRCRLNQTWRLRNRRRRIVLWKNSAWQKMQSDCHIRGLLNQIFTPNGRVRGFQNAIRHASMRR